MRNDGLWASYSAQGKMGRGGPVASSHWEGVSDASIRLDQFRHVRTRCVGPLEMPLARKKKRGETCLA
jgi:hypothetical protein